MQPPASIKALSDPIYEAFYGLKEQPFAITTDPKFFYLAASHQRAFSELLNGLRRREGLLLVTGETGSGKTTLCRAVIDSLGDRTFAAMILNPYMTGAEVLRIVLRDFGLVSHEDLRRGGLATADVSQLLDTLEGFLQSLTPLGSHAVIVLDEAQSVPPQTLDQLRLLTALEHNGQRLVQVVLCGQAGLLATLKTEALGALNERITRRVELGPFPADEVDAYIHHRLGVAGGGSAVSFDAGASRMIAELSRGIPRRINVLCDRALQEGRIEGATVITADLVKRAARAVAGAHEPPSAAPRAPASPVKVSTPPPVPPARPSVPVPPPPARSTAPPPANTPVPQSPDITKTLSPLADPAPADPAPAVSAPAASAPAAAFPAGSVTAASTPTVSPTPVAETPATTPKVTAKPDRTQAGEPATPTSAPAVRTTPTLSSPASTVRPTPAAAESTAAPPDAPRVTPAVVPAKPAVSGAEPPAAQPLARPSTLATGEAAGAALIEVAPASGPAQTLTFGQVPDEPASGTGRIWKIAIAAVLLAAAAALGYVGYARSVPSPLESLGPVPPGPARAVDAPAGPLPIPPQAPAAEAATPLESGASIEPRGDEADTIPVAPVAEPPAPADPVPAPTEPAPAPEPQTQLP